MCMHVCRRVLRGRCERDFCGSLECVDDGHGGCVQKGCVRICAKLPIVVAGNHGAWLGRSP